MIEMTRESLTTYLMREWSYSPAGANSAADKLLHLEPELKQAFERWLQSGELPQIQIETYTVTRLMTEFGYNPVAAILALDWLSREPEIAKASLARGFDRVKIQRT